jgi:hypothetical protein
MGVLMEVARKARSNVKILAGNMVGRSFIGGRDDLVEDTKSYSIQLKKGSPNWFRYVSPLSYVDVNLN